MAAAFWTRLGRLGRVVPLLVWLVWLNGVPAVGAETRVTVNRNPYPSTYEALPHDPVLIVGARILTGEGEQLENADLLFANGRIVAVGDVRGVPARVRRIAADGRYVTPGIIDVHSHLGNYPSPSYPAHSDGNEATSPNTAEVWTEHSVWPQDPQFPLALAGGVTTLQILPGSANLFGGRSVTLKNVPSRTVQGMKFPGAPYGLKMACGENPKRVYGGQSRSPSTRMGNVAGYRQAWIEAATYRKKWQDYYSRFDDPAVEDKPAAPERDLELETLAAVLNGEILVHNHCYRADEMAIMIDLAKEFGYEISAFHHAVEAYKLGDLLAREGICAAMWSDYWGFKLESYDGLTENAALVEAAGACAIIHSDSEHDIQRLNQEAAKTMAAGQRLGLDIPPAVAIRWITLNPALAMGIADQTGSLVAGKMADLVIWSGNPFSVYSRVDRVFIDGVERYNRHAGGNWVTDYELGQRGKMDVN